MTKSIAQALQNPKNLYKGLLPTTMVAHVDANVTNIWRLLTNINMAYPESLRCIICDGYMSARDMDEDEEDEYMTLFGFTYPYHRHCKTKTEDDLEVDRHIRRLYRCCLNSLRTIPGIDQGRGEDYNDANVTALRFGSKGYAAVIVTLYTKEKIRNTLIQVKDPGAEREGYYTPEDEASTFKHERIAVKRAIPTAIRVLDRCCPPGYGSNIVWIRDPKKHLGCLATMIKEEERLNTGRIPAYLLE